MLLFTLYLASLIKEGRKFQTRRFWKTQRVKVGNHYYAQLNLKPDSRFARLLITDVEEWDGKTISEEDAIAEGFSSPEAFLETYRTLNSNNWSDPLRKHYKITFEVLELYESIPDVPHTSYFLVDLRGEEESQQGEQDEQGIPTTRREAVQVGAQGRERENNRDSNDENARSETSDDQTELRQEANAPDFDGVRHR